MNSGKAQEKVETSIDASGRNGPANGHRSGGKNLFHGTEPNGQRIGRLQRRQLVVAQSVSFAVRKRRKRATVPIGKQLDLDMPIRNGRWSVHDGQRIQKTVSESVGGRLQKFNGILLIVHWPVQLEDATSVKSVRDGRNDVTVKKFCSSLKKFFSFFNQFRHGILDVFTRADGR